MCTGIALPTSELPSAFLERPDMAARLYQRGAMAEARFLWRQAPAILPVWWHGALVPMQWGSKDRRGPLPAGGWAGEDQVAAGLFQHLRAEPVVIPAKFGHDAGMWFAITEGVRGVAVRGPRGWPVVYVLTTTSTNYYRNMTEQNPRMPVLVAQVI